MKTLDGSAGIMSIFSVQNDTLVYEYSVPISETYNKYAVVETISIPELNAEIYYNN